MSGGPGPEPGAAIRLPTATIEQLSEALAAGALTSVDLVAMYLDRIAFYDRGPEGLNSVPVLNPDVLDEARGADMRRRRGDEVGPLHGLPFVVKDSFAVGGMTLAAGSPAFQDLVAAEDAATVALLREAGAIVLGKTTMPPMAAGGMQLGVYGRPRSPFNPSCLPAGWLSGSSSGSAVAVAAGLAAFGLGEETLSSGRSPASNNGLVTYVPSRGLISLRGNWPLMSLRDAVAPYARSVADLLHLLDVLVVDDDRDPARSFDLWRDQEAVALPAPSASRPRSYLELRDPGALEGMTIGIPRPFAGKGAAGEGSIDLDPQVELLWAQAEADLRAIGAELVEVEPPAFELFSDLKEAEAMARLGYWPAGFPPLEWVRLIASTWDTFLRQNGDPSLPSLRALADFSSIFPEEFHGLGPEFNPMGRYDYAGIAAEAAAGTVPIWEIEGLAGAIAGLERFRRDHLDSWMEARGIGLLAFPAHSGIGPAAADRDPAAALAAWRPGVNYALGGTAMRALGIPSVVVPMGTMAATGMPVGITFAGAGFSDLEVLAAGYAFECATGHRSDPLHAPVAPYEHLIPSPRSPELDGDAGAGAIGPGALQIEVVDYDGSRLRLAVEIEAAGVTELTVTVDGSPVAGIEPRPGRQQIEVSRASAGERTTVDGPQGGLAVARAALDPGVRVGAFAEFDRPRRYRLPR